MPNGNRHIFKSTCSARLANKRNGGSLMFHPGMWRQLIRFITGSDRITHDSGDISGHFRTDTASNGRQLKSRTFSGKLEPSVNQLAKAIEILRGHGSCHSLMPQWFGANQNSSVCFHSLLYSARVVSFQSLKWKIVCQLNRNVLSKHHVLAFILLWRH